SRTAYYGTSGRLLPQPLPYSLDTITGPPMSSSGRHPHDLSIPEYGKALSTCRIVSLHACNLSFVWYTIHRAFSASNYGNVEMFAWIMRCTKYKRRRTVRVSSFEYLIDHVAVMLHHDSVSFLSQRLDSHILAVSGSCRRILPRVGLVQGVVPVPSGLGQIPGRGISAGEESTHRPIRPEGRRVLHQF